MKLIIITADDFGRSHEINQAIVRAHREGILTCASLMVAGEAVEEAVAIAKENPKLGVGLHLVLIDGPAVLPRQRIPDLVDERRFFPNSPARLGMRYTLSRRVRAQLEAEIDAQFDRFASFGIPLSHVDGHQHMHLLPAVFPVVARLAKKFGAHGIRIVRGERRAGFNPPTGEGGLRPALRRLIWAGSFAWMSRSATRVIRGTGFQPVVDARKVEQFPILASPTRVENPCHDNALYCSEARPFIIADRVYGLMQTGNMNVAYLDAVLRSLAQRTSDELIEIYFHPTLGPRLDDFGPNPEDFQTLIDPQIKQLIRSSGIELTTYRDANNIFRLIVPARRENPGCSA